MTKKPHGLKGIPKTEAHKEAMRKPKSNTANMTGGFKTLYDCPICLEKITAINLKRHIKSKHPDAEI